jgi:hypothetical protein
MAPESSPQSTSRAEGQSAVRLPDDDLRREMLVVDPDVAGLSHIGLVGGTYTVLVSGADTAGRVLPHRHAHPIGRGPRPAPARLRGDVHRPAR